LQRFGGWRISTRAPLLFDVREGVRFIPDDEGLEFPGIDAADMKQLKPPPDR